MENKIKFRKWLRQGLLIFGIYTLYGLTILLQSYTVILRYPGPNQQTLGGALGLSALGAYTWAVLTPFIAGLGRRLPVNQKKILRNLLLHLCIGIGFGTLDRAVYVLLNPLISPGMIVMPESPGHRILWFLGHVFQSFFEYIIIAAVYQAYLHFRESQDREFRLQQAELQALKTQLHPHFLFNTLNAISSLVSSSPKAAQKTIAQLSDLLRLSLKDDRRQEISLKDELDFLRKYVQIQQTLLQERLEVEWNIHPETLDALVPSLILQPLIENSIRHGIAPKENGGSISINAERQNGMLAFVLSDNGLGLSSDKDSHSGNGIGLTNTRTRLQYLYGDAHQFALSESPNGGVTVNIKIPFKESATDN